MHKLTMPMDNKDSENNYLRINIRMNERRK